MGLLRLFLPRWARRVLWAVLFLGFGVVVGLRLFVWPETRAAAAADAIVMFQGGEGERLVEVQRLLELGVADVAIVPEGQNMGIAGLCGTHEDHRVICGTPAVANTAGEAAFFAAIAEREGFEHLVAVTSSYHATRATQELSRCHDGSVGQAPARPALPATVYGTRVAHEAVGLFQSMLRSGCPSPGWLEDGTPAGG